MGDVDDAVNAHEAYIAAGGVAEWRSRHEQAPGVVYEANGDVGRLADALDAFTAAVREEQQRHEDH